MDYRKIIHIDMDAFFASVEQRDNPALRGIPVAIGSPEARGVVATASYEARPYGVRSAMSSKRALALCPHLVFVRPRFDVYKQVSAQMHEIFHEYTDLIEPISLDEAFLDVTVNKPGIDLAVTVALEIKQKIRDRLALTASAGISYNKFLAKIASDVRKPDGICTIHPSQASGFIAALPIERFWGVGPATAKKMHSMGIHTGLDLRNTPLEILTQSFGKSGTVYYNFARGLDNRPVTPSRIRKSVGCESTLANDVTGRQEIIEIIEELSFDLVRRLERAGFSGHTFTLKIKHQDFSQHTRSASYADTSWPRGRIVDTATALLDQYSYSRNPIRLIGLTISNPPAASHDCTDTCSHPDSDGLQLLIDFESGY